MADAKKLLFQFVVDEASLSKTRNMIRELTADLQKLSEAAGKSGGGSGGGILGGMSVGGAKSPEQARVVAKTAPAGRQLVQGFLDQKQIFKGIADGSKDSMRVMNESLKQAIDFQKRELRDLDNSAKHLTETYDELTQQINKFKTGRGSGWQAEATRLEGERAGIGTEHQKIVSERFRETESLKALEEMGGDGSGGGGGGAALTGQLSGAGGRGATGMSLIISH